eukprot:3626773-Pyramimonas_sp.AAC.1
MVDPGTVQLALGGQFLAFERPAWLFCLGAVRSCGGGWGAERPITRCCAHPGVAVAFGDAMASLWGP